MLTKSGLQPGHTLILTKPVGMGVILAGWMRGRAKGRWVTGAIESMLLSNGERITSGGCSLRARIACCLTTGAPHAECRAFQARPWAFC